MNIQGLMTTSQKVSARGARSSTVGHPRRRLTDAGALTPRAPQTGTNSVGLDWLALKATGSTSLDTWATKATSSTSCDTWAAKATSSTSCDAWASKATSSTSCDTWSSKTTSSASQGNTPRKVPEGKRGSTDDTWSPKTTSTASQSNTSRQASKAPAKAAGTDVLQQVVGELQQDAAVPKAVGADVLQQAVGGLRQETLSQIGAMSQLLNRIFGEADTDNDGYITRTELRQLFLRVNGEVAQEAEQLALAGEPRGELDARRFIDIFLQLATKASNGAELLAQLSKSAPRRPSTFPAARREEPVQGGSQMPALPSLTHRASVSVPESRRTSRARPSIINSIDSVVPAQAASASKRQSIVAEPPAQPSATKGRRPFVGRVLGTVSRPKQADTGLGRTFVLWTQSSKKSSEAEPDAAEPT